MKTTKIILTLLLLTATATLSNAQTSVRLRTSAVTYSYYNSDSKSWGKWVDRKDCNVLINIASGRVKIFSAETQIYDVIKVDDKVVTEDGTTLYTYHCLNKKDQECNIIYKIYPKGDMQFFVFDTNALLAWYYDVVFVD
jgi:hypothetical protein